MVHCEVGTESTWEAFVLECNKNKENGNHLSTDIIDIKQPVSRRRDPRLAILTFQNGVPKRQTTQ